MANEFDPRFQFHEGETGKTVSVTINDETMHTLAPGETAEINLNYENKDVDDQGFITYVDRYTAIQDINTVLGINDSFERPQIVEPAYNDVDWGGKLRSTPFVAKTPGVTHVKSVWEFSWYPDFDDTSRPLKNPKPIEITQGDLTTGFFLVTSNSSLFMRVTYYGSDGKSLTSLPKVALGTADEGYEFKLKFTKSSGEAITSLKESYDKNNTSGHLVRDYPVQLELYDFNSAGNIVVPVSPVERIQVRIIRGDTYGLTPGGSIDEQECDRIFGLDSGQGSNGEITLNLSGQDLVSVRELDSNSDTISTEEAGDYRTYKVKDLLVRLTNPNVFSYSLWVLVRVWRNGYDSPWICNKINLYNALASVTRIGITPSGFSNMLETDGILDLNRTMPTAELVGLTHTGTHKATKWEIVRRMRGSQDVSTDVILNSYTSEFYKTFIGPGYERSINRKETLSCGEGLVGKDDRSLVGYYLFDQDDYDYQGVKSYDNAISNNGRLSWTSAGKTITNVDGMMKIQSTNNNYDAAPCINLNEILSGTNGASFEIKFRLDIATNASAYSTWPSIFSIRDNSKDLFTLGFTKNDSSDTFKANFHCIQNVTGSSYHQGDIVTIAKVRDEFITATVTFANDRARVYINGIEIWNNTFSMTNSNQMTKLYLTSSSRFEPNGITYFKSIKINNRTLNASEVKQNFNEGFILPSNVTRPYTGDSFLSVSDYSYSKFKTYNNVTGDLGDVCTGYNGIPLNSSLVRYIGLRSDIYDMYLKVSVGLIDSDPDDVTWINAGYSRIELGMTNKYENDRRFDLFSNTIFKLPFLTKDSTAESNFSYLGRKLIYPFNPSKTILSPLGVSGSVLSEYEEVPNTSILESTYMSPISFEEYPTDDLFNITVFDNLDQLVDMIYSLSFHREVNYSSSRLAKGVTAEIDKYVDAKMIRRPIIIYCDKDSFNKIEGIKVNSSYNSDPSVPETSSDLVPYWDSFDMSKTEIKDFLTRKGITPEEFKRNPSNVKRRLAVEVYDVIGSPAKLVTSEALVVAFKEEISSYFSGHDGYLNDVIDISKESDLDYNPSSPNVFKSTDTYDSKLTVSYNTGSNGVSGGSGYFSKKRQDTLNPVINSAETWLESFKINFDFYGLIPFRLCTENSLLGFKGHFVHREEGYEVGQEVVHPITNDLYICIKDRPGIQNPAKYNMDEYDQVNHNYPIGTPTYEVLADSTYFKKVCSFDNSEVMEESEYKNIYKSSLPTYTALLSYLNLILPAHEGLMFNPAITGSDDGYYLKTYSPSALKGDSFIKYYRVFSYDGIHHQETFHAPDEVVKNRKTSTYKEVNSTMFPYEYLNKYFEAYERNRVIKDYSALTAEDETRHALEDTLFGGWFKFKNKNYNNFIYVSSRPVLWVKDKKTIASANIVHPRQHIIRIGTKHYYVRLLADNFYPDDDCCMEPDVLGGIPSIHPDFTTFNDPYCINFRESLINQDVLAVCFKASKTTSVTNRDRQYTGTGSDYPVANAVNIVSGSIGGLYPITQSGSNRIYNLSIGSLAVDTACFKGTGSLFYNATPSNTQFNDCGTSGRKLDDLNLGTSTSDVTYNIDNIILNFEIGSDERIIFNNEVAYKHPVRFAGFAQDSDLSVTKYIIQWKSNISSGGDYTLVNSDPKTNKEYLRCKFRVTGSWKNNGIRDMFITSDNYPGTRIGAEFCNYHPVHIVLEAIEEHDLPIYNIKDSLLPFIKEPAKASLETEINNDNFRGTPQDKQYLLGILGSKDRKGYMENSTVPSWDYGRSRPNIPEIINGGYHIDRVRDINYTLNSAKLKDMVNYSPKKGLTPDTYFNYDNREMWFSQNRKTYGNVNLEEFKEGQWGAYSMTESTTDTRAVKVKVYDRWSGTGYLGSLDSLSGLGDYNILNPQLERILKHKLVNNDLNRESDVNKYPIIHIYYFKGKIMLIPNDLPFDLYHPDYYGYNYTKDMEYLEYGRTKPVDRFTRNVNRVKLGNNVFDLMLPYLANDRSLHACQELRRDIIPTLYHKNPRS